MLLEYLKRCAERIKQNPEPKQPAFCRSWMLPDGTLVTADSYEDTEMDSSNPCNQPDFIDYYNSGQKPPVVGSLQSTTQMTAAQFSEAFIRKFNSLKTLKDDNPAKKGDSLGNQPNEPANKPADPVA